MTRYRMRMLGEQSGLSVREFDTPEDIAAVARKEPRSTRSMFIIKAVEWDGTEREPSDEEATRLYAAMSGE